MRVPPLVCVWGIPQLQSDGACPVTTDLLMRVNVGTTTTTGYVLVGTFAYTVHVHSVCARGALVRSETWPSRWLWSAVVAVRPRMA